MKTSTATFFKTYADALLSYDAKKITTCYQVPMTVYSDNGAQLVTKMEEVEDFWKEGVKPYKTSGIKNTDFEILSEEQLSKTIQVCKVRWKNYDADDKEVQGETNFYILSRSEDDFKISGLIIMG